VRGHRITSEGTSKRLIEPPTPLEAFGIICRYRLLHFIDDVATATGSSHLGRRQGQIFESLID
jgi:hypothetical protein